MARALATHAMRARPSSALVSSCLLSLLVACARRGAGGSRRPWRHRGSRPGGHLDHAGGGFVFKLRQYGLRRSDDSSL